MPEEPCRRAPATADVEALYRRLSADERDELLQCLLIAAPRGGEAMIKVIEDLMLCYAADELLKGCEG